MTLPTFNITENHAQLVPGERIRCRNCAEGGYCDLMFLPSRGHYGVIVAGEPGSKNVIVKFDDRNFTESVARTAIVRSDQ